MLAIDNTAVTKQQVTSIAAYTATSFPIQARQSGTGECPAYDVGPGGYVVINTTVMDANGHLYEYYVDAQYGHGKEGPVADPGPRGYRVNPLTSPTGGVCGAGDADYACKGWVGGSDVAYFPCAPGGTQCTTCRCPLLTHPVNFGFAGCRTSTIWLPFHPSPASETSDFNNIRAFNKFRALAGAALGCSLSGSVFPDQCLKQRTFAAAQPHNIFPYGDFVGSHDRLRRSGRAESNSSNPFNFVEASH